MSGTNEAAPAATKWWQRRWVGPVVVVFGLIERFIGWGGSIDFILSRWNEPGWVGQVLRFLAQYSAYFGLLLTLGGLALIVLNERLRTDRKFAAIGSNSSPAPRPTPSAVEKVALLNGHLAEMFKVLGIAMGADTPLNYDLAMTQCEAFLLDLSRRNDISIPEMRRDGTKAGCLRLVKYLSDITPAFQLDDDAEARRRANELVPVLNRMSVAELEKSLGLNLITPPYEPVAPSQPNPQFSYAFKKAVLAADFPKPTGSRDDTGMLEMHCVISVENRHGKPLKNCSVRVISLAARGITLPVDEDLRIGQAGTFDVAPNMPTRARFIHRDLKDRISKPPFLLRLVSRELPLDDNTQYVMSLELRSEYEYPTKVGVQLDVGELGLIAVTLLDQSV